MVRKDAEIKENKMRHHKQMVQLRDRRDFVNRQIVSKVSLFKNEIYTLKAMVQKELVFEMQR